MKKMINLLSLLAVIFAGQTFAAQPADINYNPQINPADFSTTIDNPYFTLTPGMTFVYKNKTENGIETNKMIVTNLIREVMGVKTLVVWDRVWLNNDLIEETYDWYAQDNAGNVWYFGEESREYENGKVSSTHGSWETGIDGAQPGIIMKANPQIGDSYRQEYYQGEAEDMADILALDESVTTPYDSFSNCIKTKDWTPLDPDNVENKYFCHNIGQMATAINLATGEKDELVDVQKNANILFLIKDEKADNIHAQMKYDDIGNDDADESTDKDEDTEEEEGEISENIFVGGGIGAAGLILGLAAGFMLGKRRRKSSS